MVVVVVAAALALVVSVGLCVLVVGNSLLDVLGGGRAGEPTDKNSLLGVLVTARAAVWRLLARFSRRARARPAPPTSDPRGGERERERMCVDVSE